MLIERFAQAADCELQTGLSRLAQARVEWDGIEVRLSGVIVFEAEDCFGR
jgi:hypothetical protein